MKMRRPGALLALVAAATAPAAGADWLRGYGRTLAGAEMTYHSPYPDITSALISRASDGAMAVEWETEALPADWKGGPATFVWLAGHATGKGGHRFDLAVDGKAALSFRTSADASRRDWREEGAGGVSLTFKTVMVDQFDELFGFMWLEVPAALLRPGRPLTLRVTGEKAGSNDWFMVFRDDLRRDVWARSEQALVRKDGRTLQIVRVEISHLAEPAGALVSCGAEKARLDLKLGYNALEFLVPAVDKERLVTLEVALDDGSVRRGELTVKPVVPREIWLLPHSHVDIGYSDPQPVVEKNHWRYFEEAIALAAKSAGYPEGARFKWNTEQAWAVETYFRQASEAEKEAFIEALRRGTIELQATLAGVLTGLCHPEELIRLTAFARDLGRRAGVPVDSAMVTDIPGQSWSFVPALAMAGIKYVSSGPNYMPSLFDGGDRIGWALKAWGDKPFYWRSPSGEERVLFWMAGRGYSWFHGLNMGSLVKAPPYRIFEYMDELAEKRYPYSMVQVRYTVGGDNGPPDATLAATVRSWNEKYVSPRIVIATASEMFAELERRHGAAIPEVRGDFTGYWEDGAASTARETAMSRGRGGTARPGRSAVVHPGPGRIPGREGRGSLAAGRPLQRAHLGRFRQRLEPGRRGAEGPMGLQEGLRGPGRAAVTGASRRGGGVRSGREGRRRRQHLLVGAHGPRHPPRGDERGRRPRHRRRRRGRAFAAAPDGRAGLRRPGRAGLRRETVHGPRRA